MGYYSNKRNIESFINDPVVFLYIKLYINSHLEKLDSNSLLLMNSKNINEISTARNNSLSLFINKNKINDIRRINKYFIELNKKMKNNGILICNLETKELRRIRILKKNNYILFTLFYPIDFFYKRVMPKIFGFKKIYFALSKGKNRVLSLCEALGRLYYCGFALLKMKEIDNKLYLFLKKVGIPSSDKNPSYHLIYKKKAIGKNGKIIYPYKFRTMHPYAEYLQDYAVHQTGYSKQGAGIAKINNDFRITAWGRFLRKTWLDELPQLINVLKGEMKLVGVRPLSESFLSLYPVDMIKERNKQKPGCIPPYVAHIHNSLEEYIEIDEKYINYKKKHPIWCDFKYFFWGVFNILTGRIKSK